MEVCQTLLVIVFSFSSLVAVARNTVHTGRPGSDLDRFEQIKPFFAEFDDRVWNLPPFE